MSKHFRSSTIALAILFLVFVAFPSWSQGAVSANPAVSPETFTASDWTSWASIAWNYYQPNVGVNSVTGLHRATLAWTCFTDWDLGTYIYSIIFARKLGLITDTGTWQFNDRVTKVLTFLQNRPLGTNNTPYLAYSWTFAGSQYQACPDFGTSSLTGPSDSGRLLAALYALKTYSPSYASTINSIFTRSRLAYNTLASHIGFDYYGYLAAEGYVGFGYSESNVFNSIDNYAGSTVSVNGQNLPAFPTLAEPLNHVVLEGDTLIHPPSSKFLDFANRVYLAQRARYSGTGSLTARSEGGYISPAYVYEWIIYPSKTSKQWIIGDALLSTTYNIQPMAYTKVAFAYLALYGENTYTTALVNAAKNLATTQGFGEATLENGSSAISLYGSSTTGFYSDKTNEFILAAAYHVLQSQPTAPPSAVSDLSSLVINAADGSVWFILPDFVGQYHSPVTKCSGIGSAQLSDYSAGGYVLGLLSNPQNQILDTSSSISTSTCGSPTGLTGTIVALAGPGVNTVVYYYEVVAARTPVYYLWDGSKHNFVVRATGQRYSVPGGNTSPGNDLFLIESVVDSQGRHVFVLYGFSWQGTLAAATFLNRSVKSNLSQFTNGWYIYQWKDASSGSSANSFPDSGDQYIPMATG